MNINESFHFGVGATNEDLERLRGYAGFDLPEAYARFLHFSNGAAGWVGRAFVDIWSVDGLLQENEVSHLHAEEPRLLLFASDGASETYAFDMRTPGSPVVMVPHIGELDEALPFAPSFGEFFIALLAQGEDRRYLTV